jgi:SAM-dependent MidA family methyltransferase
VAEEIDREIHELQGWINTNISLFYRDAEVLSILTDFVTAANVSGGFDKVPAETFQLIYKRIKNRIDSMREAYAQAQNQTH